MKKLLLFVLVLILSQSQINIGFKEVMARDNYSLSKHVEVETFTKNKDGMTYRVFFYSDNYAGGIHVINVTKEKLEVEKLRLEIKKLR